METTGGKCGDPKTSADVLKRIMQISLFNWRDSSISCLTVEEDIQGDDGTADNPDLTENLRPVDGLVARSKAGTGNGLVSGETFGDGGKDER